MQDYDSKINEQTVYSNLQMEKEEDDEDMENTPLQFDLSDDVRSAGKLLQQIIRSIIQHFYHGGKLQEEDDTPL